MHISRPEFSSPVICIDDFLADADADNILQKCVELEHSFVPATINDRRTGPKYDRTYRSNHVLYLKGTGPQSAPITDILSILQDKIWSEECKRLWHEGEYIFDIINYSNFQSGAVSRYGDGDFYRQHRDTVWSEITHRLVTIVYYVNKIPGIFTGGRLMLLKAGCELSLEPRHNRAVVFPSFTVHEVETVRTNSAEWADGRFSLNYWIGFR